MSTSSSCTRVPSSAGSGSKAPTSSSAAPASRCWARRRTTGFVDADARSRLAADTAHQSTDHAGRRTRLRTLRDRVLTERCGEAREGQRLQPHPSRADELGEEDAVAAEDLVLDAFDGGDVEPDGVLEEPDMAGVNLELLARAQVVGDHLAAQLAPHPALAADALQPEAVAAEDTGAEALLEADGHLDAVGPGHERVPVAEELHPRLRLHVEREDLPRELGGEGDHARRPLGGVVGHEERATAHGALEDAADAATTTVLRRRVHLDARGHPRQLAGLREDRLAGVEGQLEDR